jgi:hypothetical protein
MVVCLHVLTCDMLSKVEEGMCPCLLFPAEPYLDGAELQLPCLLLGILLLDVVAVKEPWAQVLRHLVQLLGCLN